ncbi:hypothetical protein [Micromonospora sp. HM5-17]|jgi:hypothetical protein|uniref:hypothetical protein n=1 Tax=Micromonospora sp. HM5-17 TaxID=2487710 RepID=UPI000F4A91E8|nr:hypothetical protein [Micromonospora sp. HM5-17]ROT31529.1 hypothetical protein EF879_13920 [Micromonospora sp. HM5-17]
MLTAAQVLAANNFGDTRAGGLAGPMGLFLIVLLAIATVLLIRNMNARLRRLPDRFPHQGAGEPDGVAPMASAAGETAGVEESRGNAPKGSDQGRKSQIAP